MIVVYDANVLYPAAVRDLLLELAGSGAFRARYSSQILDETFEHLATNFPDVAPATWQQTRRLIERAVPTLSSRATRRSFGSFALSDPDDRHVLAAAITSGGR